MECNSNYRILNNQVKIPCAAFGTYKAAEGNSADIIGTAIRAGYRHFDTASVYGTEKYVAEAIEKSRIPRQEFFLTSKVWKEDMGYEQTKAAFAKTLEQLNTDYLDLYLIHWPLPKRGLYVEAWKAMVTAQKLGLIRSIGVSNFEPEHLDKIIDETGVTPAINQIEIHPYWVQERMVEADKERGILTEAWSPLGRGSDALKEAVITELAEKYGKTSAQVILRWHAQRGIIPIPKSRNLQHQRENLAIFDFELTQTEIERINLLEKADGRIEGQDPNEYEEFD